MRRGRTCTSRSAPAIDRSTRSPACRPGPRGAEVPWGALPAQRTPRRLLRLALAVAAFAAAHAPAPAQERALALVGGMLLDGHDGPPLHHAAVVIEGQKIVAVGPRAEVTIPEGATVVDTRGRT